MSAPGGFSVGAELAARVKAVVMLAGSIRSTDLGRDIGRSILELPALAGKTILDRWCDEVSGWAAMLPRDELHLRVMVDKTALPPAQPRGRPGVRVSIEQDKADFRGTAGILRDISGDYAPSDYVVVANGNVMPTAGVIEAVGALLRTRADAALVAHRDGSPVNLMLVRMGLMSGVRDVGFMDFKEQVLPELAKKHDVRVVIRDEADGISVRDLDGYIDALRVIERVAQGKTPSDDGAWSEQWFPTFRLVEDGAMVASSARVHDSVVLAGGSVGADATIVRSVVCEGARIPAGAVVADRVVTRQTRLDDAGGGR